MKKILLLLALLPLMASAYDVQIDGIYYNLNNSTKEATVTSGNPKYTGSVTIPETILYNGITYSVTTIGKNAFYNCSGLSEVKIPNSVTSIGESAFDRCKGLASVNIGDGVVTIGDYAFYYCSSLTEVIIPNRVTLIGKSAFSGCSGLTEMTIPNNVTSIGNYAFNECSNLTEVIIGNRVTTIGYRAFYNCTGNLTVNCNIPSASSYDYGAFCSSKFSSVKIGDGVETIGDYAFCGSKGLSSVTIPNSVTSIGRSAFNGCSSMTSVTISNNVTSIGSYAFGGCTGKLTVNCNIPAASSSSDGAFCASKFSSVTVGDEVETIGDYAFYYCSDLTEVTIPNSVTSIGRSAFYNCSSVSKITIPNNVVSIGDYTFYGCSGLTAVTIGNSVTSIGSYAFYKCTGNLTINCDIPSASSYYNGVFYASDFSSVTIGDEVETIGDNAFYGCSSLSSVIMGNGVTLIGKSAFSGCSSLTSIEISNNVKEIGNSAFYNCSGLTEMTIPNNVTSIGNNAFNGCSSLTEVVIGNGVTTIGYRAFYNCTGNLTINCDIPSASSYYNGVFYASDFSSVTIGDEVETIGDYAFYDCSNLTSLTIGNYVTSIGNNAFYGCSGLTSIIIGSWNHTYDSRDNSNAIIETASNILIIGSNSTVIPKSVTTINSNAFRNRSSLTKVTIPNSVTSIGSNAFFGCSGLTSIIVESGNTKYDSRDNCNSIINTATNALMYGSKNTVIPNSVISISSNAFRGLSGLTEVTIPNSITSIGDYAFADCKELKSVTVRLANPIKIKKEVFSDSIYKNTVLYVPTGRKTFFEDATVWEKFANIQEMDMPDVEISDSPFANVGRNQMILGYYRTDDYATDGLGISTGRYKACIGFDKEKVRPFAGNKITHVRFALLNTDISDVKVWIGSARDAAPQYTQDVQSLATGWNEVKLDKAYEIFDDSIFIGIEYNQQKAICPMSYVKDGYEEGSFYIYSHNDNMWLDGRYCMSLQCLIEGDKIPMYDIRLTNIIVDKYFKQGEKVSGYISCRNWGKKEPQTFDAEIKLNGAQVYIFQNRGFYSSSYYTFSFIPEDPQVGNYNMEVAITALNGERPQYTDNDTLRASINIWDTDMGRQKVYLEQYTATWCPYTIGTLYSTKDMAASRDDVAFVLVHRTDQLSCNTGNKYRVLYTGTPETTLDRYSNDSKSMTHYGVYDSYIDKAKARPSFANVNISAGYDEESRQLFIKVSGEKHECFDMFEKYANLTVLLTEDNVVCPQYDGQNGTSILDWRHQAVLRTNVSEIWGDPIEWNGKKYEKKYSVTLNDLWEKDNMKIVAFLAKPFTGKNFNEIYAINCNDFLVANSIPAKGIEDLEDTIRGDANGDGEIGMPDVMFVVNYILGNPAETFNADAADANLDGEIGMPDVMFIVNHILNGKFPDE